MKIKLILLASLLVVLNFGAGMGQTGLPKPNRPVVSQDVPRKPPPQVFNSYRIKVRFIPLGSSDGTIAASIDENWCVTRLAEITAIFKPAGLQFEFGELDPLTRDDQLNLDIPPGSTKDSIETGRQRLAMKFPGELVVFVRRYLGDNPKKKSFYKAPHYSSVNADFVVAEPGGSTPWLLAHEFGHFFGLYHTFDENLLAAILAKKPADRVSYVANELANAIKTGQVTEEKALDFLDGDRDSIADTPPDVAPPIFQPHDQAGEESGPGSPDSITLTVILTQSTTSGANNKVHKYVLRPDKLNVMSYFTFTERPHLSPLQMKVVYKIVDTGKRHRLVR
jgi:hypothetical protein